MGVAWGDASGNDAGVGDAMLMAPAPAPGVAALDEATTQAPAGVGVACAPTAIGAAPRSVAPTSMAAMAPATALRSPSIVPRLSPGLRHNPVMPGPALIPVHHGSSAHLVAPGAM